MDHEEVIKRLKKLICYKKKGIKESKHKDSSNKIIMARNDIDLFEYLIKVLEGEIHV